MRYIRYLTAVAMTTHMKPKIHNGGTLFKKAIKFEFELRVGFFDFHGISSLSGKKFKKNALCKKILQVFQDIVFKENLS